MGNGMTFDVGFKAEVWNSHWMSVFGNLYWICVSPGRMFHPLSGWNVSWPRVRPLGFTTSGLSVCSLPRMVSSWGWKVQFALSLCVGQSPGMSLQPSVTCQALRV